MYPTRSAPTPPRADRGELREALPAGHPFANPFPYDTPNHYSCSTSSLSSSAYTRSASSPVSTPSRRAPQSPTARLAQPLSPARSASPPSVSTTSGRRRVDEFGRGRSMTNPAPPPAPVYATLPTELSLFEARPRQTLLQDVENILGKRMHFPFLARYSSSSCTSSSSSSAKKEKKAKKEAGKEKRTRRRLTKERPYDDNWAIWAGMDQFMDSQVVVAEEQKSRRGVRGGNWI
ncbi:hypothetical protein L202_08043 [Cryptococcus amylolentus CBS 6039]|uniref:Uncharacterized protein n=1 Tax=Cryptococcus amylolentus CBS 6039 TaxID=1295533 RepID=A0A1E3HB51_9TREE|nr:hypothetical protein L202_08043 [Cryptococcus amylolentus CBS 6039]ODN73544.1 hypothetical protein L202_08043 [Cryptococcus amylolentus CBS 6039]